jgi:hypothetical protein
MNYYGLIHPILTSVDFVCHFLYAPSRLVRSPELHKPTLEYQFGQLVAKQTSVFVLHLSDPYSSHLFVIRISPVEH